MRADALEGHDAPPGRGTLRPAMADATLRTADGVLLRARWWEAARPGDGAVVLVHGLAGSKDAPGVVALAADLAGTGHHVLAYDARGHGASGGLCTLGSLERLDVAAAVAEARRRTGRVVVAGASLGAIAALRHAVTDPDLAGVVLVSSPARWRLPWRPRVLAATALTRTAPGRRFAERRLRVRIAPGWTDSEPPVTLVARLRLPVAVVHGERDRMIRLREAVELAVAAPGPCRLRVVPGMGHAFDPAGAQAIREAVEWALAAGLPRS